VRFGEVTLMGIIRHRAKDELGLKRLSVEQFGLKRILFNFVTVTDFT
jgi:hypothetical protein